MRRNGRKLSLYRYLNPHSSLLSIFLITFVLTTMVVIVLLVLIASGAGGRAVTSGIQSTFSIVHPSTLE